MNDFAETGNLPGPARRGGILNVGQRQLTLKRVWFSGPTLYVNGNTQPLVTAPVNWWARGAFIDAPDWEAGRAINYPFWVRRGSPLSLAMIGLRWPVREAAGGTLTVTPRVRGLSSAGFTLASVDVDIPGTSDIVVVNNVSFGGVAPDFVGRLVLELDWQVTAKPGSSFTFAIEGQSSLTTAHVFYLGDDWPLDPTKDAATPNKSDTISATPKRMDRLMASLGPDARHARANSGDLDDIIWRVYVEENAKQPPYFNNDLDVCLTHDGTRERRFSGGGWVGGTGKRLPLEDQWLMWITTSAHWNHASCIGYAQLLKTMLATVGILIRRSLILPTTNLLPPLTPGGPTRPIADISPHLEGRVDETLQMTNISNRQTADVFRPDGTRVTAFPALMGRNGVGEYFEGCAVTPNGRYLPGAFELARIVSTAPQFATNRGFTSALETLRWWATTTSQNSTFQRFMCWVELDANDNLSGCWDRNGRYFAPADYEQIRISGQQLVVP